MMKEKLNNKGVFMSFNSYSSFWDKSSDTNVDEFLGIEEDSIMLESLKDGTTARWVNLLEDEDFKLI